MMSVSYATDAIHQVQPKVSQKSWELNNKLKALMPTTDNQSLDPILSGSIPTSCLLIEGHCTLTNCLSNTSIQLQLQLSLTC